jgi:uncharacterized protein
MSRMTFINLPVKDLAKSTEFFATVGFSFDPQFTDDNATRMIISDETSVMLGVEPFFETFIAPRRLADTSTSTEVIVGLSADSLEEVDDLVGKVIATGAQDRGEAQHDGFMYMRGFRTSTGTSGRSSTWIYPDSQSSSARVPGGVPCRCWTSSSPRRCKGGDVGVHRRGWLVEQRPSLVSGPNVLRPQVGAIRRATWARCGQSRDSWTQRAKSHSSRRSASSSARSAIR